MLILLYPISFFSLRTIFNTSIESLIKSNLFLFFSRLPNDHGNHCHCTPFCPSSWCHHSDTLLPLSYSHIFCGKWDGYINLTNTPRFLLFPLRVFTPAEPLFPITKQIISPATITRERKGVCCSWIILVTHRTLEVRGPIFKIPFSGLYNETSLQRHTFKISVEKVKSFGRTKQFCILYLAISYCVSLILAKIIRYIFQTDHIHVFSCEICPGGGGAHLYLKLDIIRVKKIT